MTKAKIHCPHKIPVSECEEHWPMFQDITPSTFDELEVALNEIADTASTYGENSARTVGRIKSAMKLIEGYAESRVKEEAVKYCDEGHYHDMKRDIAMLPSERLAELNVRTCACVPGDKCLMHLSELLNDPKEQS